MEAFGENRKKKFEIDFWSCFCTLRAERNGIVSACIGLFRANKESSYFWGEFDMVSSRFLEFAWVEAQEVDPVGLLDPSLTLKPVQALLGHPTAF